MKINQISSSFNSTNNRIYFKARDNEEEYVYIPLVWETESDTYQSTMRPQENPSDQTQTSQKNPSKFRKITGGVITTVGTVSVLPSAIEGGAKSIAHTVDSVKDSVKSSVDSIQEIRDYTRTKLGKNKTGETNQDENQIHEENNISNHGLEEEIAAGTVTVPHHDIEDDEIDDEFEENEDETTGLNIEI